MNSCPHTAVTDVLSLVQLSSLFLIYSTRLELFQDWLSMCRSVPLKKKSMFAANSRRLLQLDVVQVQKSSVHACCLAFFYFSLHADSRSLTYNFLRDVEVR